jgi:uncharacterized Zn finger protein
MTEEKEKRRHTGICSDCGGSLELVELDLKKTTKIMQCQQCGLFHSYKKDFFGNYKLVKIAKKLDMLT